MRGYQDSVPNDDKAIDRSWNGLKKRTISLGQLNRHLLWWWSWTPSMNLIDCFATRLTQIYVIHISHSLHSIGWIPSFLYVFVLNSLWPSDAIWRQGSRSTLAQVMACCLTSPSHYLNQCWLIISKVQWHPSESKFYTRYLSHQSRKLAWKLLI